MKYMVEYTSRARGESVSQTLENGAMLLNAFAKWTPEPGLKIGAFVHKVSGAGGYVLVEAEDPKAVNAFVAKFETWHAIDVIPVLEVGEAVANAAAAMTWARDAVKG